MINYAVNTKYIDIINEFRSLIDFINYKDVLMEKMFQIIDMHLIIHPPEKLIVDTNSMKNSYIDSASSAQ